VTLLVFLENWGSVFLNKPRKTIKEKNKNQQLKFFKKRKKKVWENEGMTELPENDQGNLTWNLDVWQLDFLLPWNLERIEFQKWRICECFLGIGGVRNLNSWKWETERKRGWTRGKVSVPVWASRESIVEWIKFWVFF
jgi:hypothetical protein